jgi:hypothetical protein
VENAHDHDFIRIATVDEPIGFDDDFADLRASSLTHHPAHVRKIRERPRALNDLLKPA